MAAFRDLAALALIASAISACGGTRRAAPAPAASPAPAATPAPAANPTPEIIATGDAAAIERARADSAAHPWTEADAHFMTAMIGHHAQAIVISRLAPTRAASNSIRTLAARVINAQQDEIALMQQWLRDRQQPVPDPGDTTAAMDHAGHQMSGHTMGAAHEMMPGMLSPAEIERLEQAEGVEFDRIFLSSMLKHHRGAVTMVEELFSSYGAAQDESVFRLATDINVDQITEIDRMEQLLVTLLTEGSLP